MVTNSLLAENLKTVKHSDNYYIIDHRHTKYVFFHSYIDGLLWSNIYIKLFVHNTVFSCRNTVTRQNIRPLQVSCTKALSYIQFSLVFLTRYCFVETIYYSESNFTWRHDIVRIIWEFLCRWSGYWNVDNDMNWLNLTAPGDGFNSIKGYALATNI